METINLNLIPTGARPVLHASQYDTGRQFRANLFEGSAVYTLTGAETLSIAVRKPDGHIVTEAITNTSDSYIIIETTEQMTAVAGDSFAEVKIEEGDDLLGTLNLILAVEQSPEEGGDPSESFVHNLEEQIADAVAEQYDSNNVIFDAAPTAGHGTPYTVTSEGIKTTFDNLKVGDLSDVTITSPTQGEALVFDLTDPDNPVVTNGTVSTVGSIDDLSDVDTTGKASGDSLRYNGLGWVAQPITVEMEQADYEALGGDYSGYEGCYIVITDAPNLNPTASDIEYSSGVSVADELTSLASGQTPQAVTGISYNSTNINSGSFTCYKIGRLVMLDIASLQTKIAIGSNEEELLSGLPLPLVDTGRYSLFDGDGTSRARVKVTSDGKLRMWHNPSNFTVGTGFYGNVYYISAT